jgi:hypothetical protein
VRPRHQNRAGLGWLSLSGKPAGTQGLRVDGDTSSAEDHPSKTSLARGPRRSNVKACFRGSQNGQLLWWVKPDQHMTSSVPGSDSVLEFQEAGAREPDRAPVRSLRRKRAALEKYGGASGAHCGHQRFPDAAVRQHGNGRAAAAEWRGYKLRLQPAATIVELRQSTHFELRRCLGARKGDRQPSSQQEPKPTAERQEWSLLVRPSEPGALMEMTVEVTSLSTDCLNDPLFAPAAGRQKVDLSGGVAGI